MNLRSNYSAPKYNRLVSQPEPGITLVQPIITKVLVAPRTGPYKKGETLTLNHNGIHSVTFIKADGRDRSLVLKDGTPMTYFNHYLSR